MGGGGLVGEGSELSSKGGKGLKREGSEGGAAATVPSKPMSVFDAALLAFKEEQRMLNKVWAGVRVCAHLCAERERERERERGL